MMRLIQIPKVDEMTQSQNLPGEMGVLSNPLDHHHAAGWTHKIAAIGRMSYNKIYFHGVRQNKT